MNTLFKIITFLSLIILKLSIAIGVGIALYNWGILENTLQLSLWTGFISTAWITGISWLTFCIGLILVFATED